MKRVVVGEVTLEEVEPGIVLIDYGTALATAELVQDVVERSQEEWGDGRIGVLVQAKSATDLARIGVVLSKHDLADFTIASAILTPGKLTQLIGKLFMQFQSSPFPQRQFIDAEEARAWLRVKVAEDRHASCMAN